MLLLIEMIFRRCHHKVQCAANTIDRVNVAGAEGDLRSASTTVAGGEVVNQLGPAVAIERAVVEERGEVIDKVFGRSNFVRIHYALQVYRRCCTSSPCRAAHEQQVQVVEARHPGAAVEPQGAHLISGPARYIGWVKQRLPHEGGNGRQTGSIALRSEQRAVRADGELHGPLEAAARGLTS